MTRNEVEGGSQRNWLRFTWYFKGWLVVFLAINLLVTISSLARHGLWSELFLTGLAARVLTTAIEAAICALACWGLAHVAYRLGRFLMHSPPRSDSANAVEKSAAPVSDDPNLLIKQIAKHSHGRAPPVGGNRRGEQLRRDGRPEHRKRA